MASILIRKKFTYHLRTIIREIRKKLQTTLVRLKLSFFASICERAMHYATRASGTSLQR